MKTIMVWDRYVRVFHWALVGLIAVAYVSAEDFERVHVWAGHAVLVLIVMRVVWGFSGSHYARFSSFVTSPAAALAYLKALPGRRAPRALGHNPAGGWMVLALLTAITLTTLSGLANYTAEGKGVLAAVIGPDAASHSVRLDTEVSGHDDPAESHEREHEEHDDDDALWHELHELFVNLMLALIALHIAGVLASSWSHRENLALSMLTGKKRA